MASPPLNSPAWLRRLGQLLACLQDLWRPVPFHQPRPDWCLALPELTRRLLAFPDSQALALTGDDQALLELLANYAPEAAELPGLIALPWLGGDALRHTARQSWAVPGRKRAQIEAFAGAIGAPRAPVFEWCAGKGHLGRLLGSHWQLPVTSLEHDARLCAEGERLARRAAVEQRFMAADALAPASARQLAGQHVVALHACGDLHLSLLRGAAEHGARALDLAPCCYYRTVGPRYRPLNPEADLALSRDELHLPVTETATAGAREVRLRDRQMAWKLGFLALRADLSGGGVGGTFKPVPAAWFGQGFEHFCRRLADREGVIVPSGMDLTVHEGRGWQRHAEVLRLNLVRLAFRRALEVWLALDRVLYLERAGYEVRLGVFCEPALTPRNLLISASR